MTPAKWLAAGTAVALALSCRKPPAPPAAASAPPRIVYWITVDALRADVVGSSRNGQALMPATAALAGEAVAFDDAYAQSSFTKISVASMFTGLWPQRLGVKHCAIDVHPGGVELCFGLDRGFETLAERLAAAGWETIAPPFTAHAQPGDGLMQGFTSQEAVPEKAPILRALLPLRAGVEQLRGKPVFVYHHLPGVHAPYRPSAEALARFGIEAPRRVDPTGSAWYTAAIDESQARELRGYYEALAFDSDRRVGELVQSLKAAGAWDAALVVVTADHGEEFLEHGRTQHSSQLYDESLRVPLLVKFPAGSATAAFHGRRVAARVRLADLAPTVVHLVEGAERVGYDGRSLLPLLRGEEREGRPVLAFTSVMRDHDGAPRLFEQHAVMQGRWKALAGWRPDPSQSQPAFARGDAVEELFDLSRDPGERSNRRADSDAVWQALARTTREVGGGAPVDASQRQELAERLRALGYLQ